MRAWLRRVSPSPARTASASPGPERVGVGSPASWNPDFASDPATWEEAFQSHWTQAAAIIKISENSATTFEHVLTVFKHLNQMSLLLLTEVNAQPEPSIGPILDLFFTEEIFDKVVDWCLAAPFLLAPSCQVNMLRLYEELVAQSHGPHHCLLVHKPMLLPLLRLLEWCRQTSATMPATDGQVSETEKHFVLLLNQICTKMAEDATLLEFFFNAPADESEGAQRFLVFTLLIPYLYDSGDIGQLARDGLLLVLTVSRRVESVGRFIGQQSNFCPVLATGLSGCFSQLPRRVGSMVYVGDDWHGVTTNDIETFPSLTHFFSSLLFCNAVAQVGHRLVLEQLLDYIYHGFLVSVVKPALFETGLEELISATAYLDLCFRTITEPSLTRILIKFILCETENDRRILDVLVERIGSPSRLSLVSLGLFQTLLGLHCEDLMVELVLKYFLPCTHTMPSQTARVRDDSFYQKSAERLLQLVPQCIVANPNELYSPASLQTYLSESRRLVQATLEGCSCWALPYDGVSPDPKLFREQTNSDDESSSQETSARSAAANSFSRFGSIRMSGRGLNQYFTAKRHTSNITNNSNHGFSAADLAILGPNFLLNDDELDDDEEVSEPTPIASPLLMTDTESIRQTPRYQKGPPATDYFRFAYDDLVSESEAESSKKPSLQVLPSRPDNRDDETDFSDTGAAKAYVLRGWTDVHDTDTFIEVLNRVRTSHEAASHSLEVNLALIDSKIQYMNELKAERQALAEQISGENEKKDEADATTLTLDGPRLVLGMKIDYKSSFASPEVGPFVSVLLHKLDDMLNNTLFVNLQLTGVFARLAAHPQPLLSSYLLNPDLVFQPSIRSLFQIVQSLSAKIDAHAIHVDGFDVLLQRGVKLLNSRAKRYEKALDGGTRPFVTSARRSPIPTTTTLEWHGFTTDLDTKPRSISDIFTNKHQPKVEVKPRSESDATETVVHGPKGFKYFSHKAMETQEATLDAMRTKNVVYCAIILSQFLQELAAISLEHPVALLGPNLSFFM